MWYSMWTLMKIGWYGDWLSPSVSEMRVYTLCWVSYCLSTRYHAEFPQVITSIKMGLERYEKIAWSQQNWTNNLKLLKNERPKIHGTHAGWKIKHTSDSVAGQIIRNKTFNETQEQENYCWLYVAVLLDKLRVVQLLG